MRINIRSVVYSRWKPKRNENDVEAIPGVDSGDAGWNNVMTPEITELAVEIVRFVDDYQPGIVACEFFDAEG